MRARYLIRKKQRGKLLLSFILSVTIFDVDWSKHIESRRRDERFTRIQVNSILLMKKTERRNRNE